jgi:predicted outer membrane repeat protein
VVDGNAATTSGGGVYAATSATFSSSTFSGNDAPSGGGVYYAGSSGTLTLTGSLLTGNHATAGQGGGVYQYAGALVATCTSSAAHGFTANTATSGGGGVYLRVKGSGSVFTSSTCDFGTTSASNNSPQDVLYVNRAYDYGDNQTLTCRNGTCR